MTRREHDDDDINILSLRVNGIVQQMKALPQDSRPGVKPWDQHVVGRREVTPTLFPLTSVCVRYSLVPSC